MDLLERITPGRYQAPPVDDVMRSMARQMAAASNHDTIARNIGWPVVNAYLLPFENRSVNFGPRVYDSVMSGMEDPAGTEVVSRIPDVFR